MLGSRWFSSLEAMLVCGRVLRRCDNSSQAFGLLIFGKRLPEVGKSLGKGIVEFKKGLKGIEDDIEVASSQPTPQQRAQLQQPAYQQPAYQAPEYQAPAPQPPHKFDPYTGKPLDPNASATSTPPGTA